MAEYKSRVIVRTDKGLVAYNSGKNFRTLDAAKKNMRATDKQFTKLGMKVVKLQVIQMDKLRRR